MREKLHHLKMIRKDIGDESFRVAAATVITNYYLELLEIKGKKAKRSNVVDQVNVVLHSMGLKTMSYSFFRRFL